MFRWPFRTTIPDALARSSRWIWATGALFLGTVSLGEGLLLWESHGFLAAFCLVTALSVVASAAHHGVHVFEAIRPVRVVRTVWPDALLVGAMAATVSTPEVVALIGTVRTFVLFAHVASETDAGRRFWDSLVENPAKLLVISFGVLIAFGTVFLMFPRATDDGLGASPVDALFTATSAVCVTGLTVLTTARDALAPADVQAFSPFGQVVILVLIQVGGLGIMTLSTSAVLLVGGRLSLRGSALAQEVLDEPGAFTVQRMVRSILVSTFAFEVIGAVILAARFVSEVPEDPEYAVYLGVFHAISAFCNAGFSLFSQNLTAYRDDPVVLGTMALLIIFGGLGFMVIPVLFAPKTWAQGFRTGIRRMPTHARVVVSATVSLIAAGMVLLLILDATGAQADLTIGERLWASFFQSVSARTAGFNTMDLARTARPAVFVYLFLMFIGASPGGTGGGVKTTTFVLMFAALRATLMGRGEVEVFGRTIPHRTVNKAIAITALSASVCLIASVVLLATQPALSVEQVLFEVVSAFGTVGLSLGATPHLDALGRVLISLMMFIGRVGPLTITLALASRSVTSEVRYPEGRVLVG